nr:RecName: Full=Unknown endosperm protein B [Hordeum vulgare]
EKDCYHERDC